MKSSSASLFGVVVAILTLVSAVLLVASESYGTALLAIALGSGVAVLLFTAQNIVGHLEELRHDIETLRGTSNKNSSFETSIKELKTEISKLSESTSIALRRLPTHNTPLSNNIGAATTALSPPAPFTPPEPPPSISSLKKDNYQAFGASLSSSSSSPLSSLKQNPDQNLVSKFPSPSDDPNRTNASFASLKNPTTSANNAVNHTGDHDLMETTQSFLPHIVSSGHSEEPRNESKSTTLSTQDTIGFEPSALAPAEPEPTSATYLEPLKPPFKPPSKTHSKIKKRYSTFAGLSLSEDIPEGNKHRDNILIPPPPPPPPNKIEKKRYSTFAGIALGERNRISPPSVPSPSSTPASPSAKPGNPLSILSPSTVTNLGFSKNTDGIGVSREELVESQAKAQANLTYPIQPTPATPAPPDPIAPMAKGTRKRYQTFMGLSLSKTPQPIKRYEESSIEATTPLPVAIGAGTSYTKAPTPSALQAAINRGQQGNLVDGFCSLCGSPQAAANDYANTGSEPEFCWYCGAKLK